MLPRRLKAVVAVATALALSGALVACSGASQSGDPAPISCPARQSSAEPWVPSQPTGIDAKTQMVPQQTPSEAVICAYAVPANIDGPSVTTLTGTQQLAGGLTELASDLSWLPRELPGAAYSCPAIGLGQQTHYLLGLTYPTGTEWVSSTDDVSDCTTTSNGRFTSSVNIGAQVAASYQSASWAPIPPPHMSLGNDDPCSTWRSGRLGQEKQIVPGQPRSILVCEGTYGPPTTTYRSVAVDHGFAALVDALNAVPTSPTKSGCQGNGVQTNFYQLVIKYQDGPSVAVEIDPHCSPPINNWSLQGADATHVVPLLEQLIPPR